MDCIIPAETYDTSTHWGQVTNICISKLNIIVSDNGLSPGRRQAIIWTNDKILSIGPLRKNFSEIITGIYIFWFKKIHQVIRKLAAIFSEMKQKPVCPLKANTTGQKTDSQGSKFPGYVV